MIVCHYEKENIPLYPYSVEATILLDGCIPKDIPQRLANKRRYYDDRLDQKGRRKKSTRTGSEGRHMVVSFA